MEKALGGDDAERAKTIAEQKKSAFKANRQAVVIIHGIGNQRPMDTLRPFVDAVLEVDPEKEGDSQKRKHSKSLSKSKVDPEKEGDSQNGKDPKYLSKSKVDPEKEGDPQNGKDPKYLSKPDNVSESYELRRLQSTAEDKPPTDYYEFYWQHLMPAADWQRVWAWVRLLLFRRSGDVPEALMGLWWISRSLTVLFVALIVSPIIFWLAYCLGVTWVGDLHEWLESIFARLSNFTGLTVSILSVGLALIGLLLRFVVMNYVGDAAIYLSPTPRNIQARQAIRNAGVSLINRLHSGQGSEQRYDRIVIIGHSLGSVIGYDILTYAWVNYLWKHKSPVKPSQEALERAEKAAQRLRDLDCPSTSACQRKKSAQQDWWRASRSLWLEQRANTFPWLITDFVTLGSPLTHGFLLLARSRAEFLRKKRQYELPVCPPELNEDLKFSYKLPYKIGFNTLRTVFCLHHAACFAVTRWTNLYFPARYYLKGDLIGGRLGDLFGPGIRDIEVKTSVRKGFFAHTKYWKPPKRKQEKFCEAIDCLRTVLDLERNSFDPNDFDPNLNEPSLCTAAYPCPRDR